ncbi:unnamed protein product [Cuscuta campestris]|uniref:RRM domain-containing protein n=1 Tax=Cuscuta campestris TaxID=132261 RepID=A0A484LLP2_9ASTE|nr:unnamed protein product [Cuscuta campestris]
MLCSSLAASDGSSEKDPQPKKSELAKQRKTEIVESFVRKYMEENKGMFPKTIHVHKEVGGSWHSLKGMLEFIKEKLTGKSEEQKSPDEAKVSGNIMSHRVDDSSGDGAHIHQHADKADAESVPHNVNLPINSEPEVGTKIESVSDNVNLSINSEPEVGTKIVSQTVPGFVQQLQNCEPSRNDSSNQKTENKDIFSGIISVIKVRNSTRLDEASPSNTLVPSEETKNLLDSSITSFLDKSTEPFHDVSGDASSDINGLIGCLKALPQVPIDRPRETKICNNGSEDRSGRSVITPSFEKKEGNASPLHHLFVPVKKNSPHSEVVQPVREKGNVNQQTRNGANSFEKESLQNKVLVRFLPKFVEHKDIAQAFSDISKVLVSSPISSSYGSAYVYFKSEEGMKKALERTDVQVKGSTVIVGPATSTPLKGVRRASIPDLIGLPDVPAALVKNPKLTVMITDIARETRFHHIQHAFSFAKTKISQVLFGSSQNVAFVEFETEEDKENALTRHSINGLGRKSLICRVDAPKTTVVRISNFVWSSREELPALCKSFGNVKSLQRRNRDTTDVHFHIAEWPNMATILNRLNGTEIGGQRLIAQPAPVYPPDVLEALWNDGEGRQHLRNTFHNLLKNISGSSPVGAGTEEVIDGLFEDRVRS